MPYARVVPVVDLRVRGMCCLPYEGHPRGCPNYGVSARCPPKVANLADAYDLDGPFYVVWSAFPLGEHVAAMRARHPEWSERQLRCVLYWQGTARKRLRAEVAVFRGERPEVDWLVETTPEAMGLDVTRTVEQAGLVLPWPPGDVVYHVALAGRHREIRLRYDGPGSEGDSTVDCERAEDEADLIMFRATHRGA